ncbi:Tripartite motif-containing protein 3 [Holothuria leucospilota]|uniref:Tripartite motif-containing protein 3 n=1 Tax=Holothuria leucospilota TaxID=206669 RepID=A0A9Q1C5C8_HOLLE|nr:Tripartite motif-containing protein 3 [Holothuria leucospilota]
MAQQGMDDLHETVKCLICLNVWTRPKTLPCQHIFCEKCLEQRSIQSANGDVLMCPKCRKLHIIPCQGLRASWPTQKELESLAENIKHLCFTNPPLATLPSAYPLQSQSRFDAPSSVVRTSHSSRIMPMALGCSSPMIPTRPSSQADPQKSDVTVTDASDLKRMMVGELLTMFVQLRDQDGQIMATKQGVHDIRALLHVKPRPSEYQPIEIKANITQEGKCFIVYQLRQSGLHAFTVQLNGIPMKGTPIEFPVIPRGILGCEIKGPLKGPRDVAGLNGYFLVTDGIAKAVFLVDEVGREIGKLKVPEEMLDSFAPMAIVTFQNKVFVTDMGNKCIHVYENLDELPSQFGHPYVQKPTGVAVSGASGDIFIVDNDLKQVIVFNQSYRYMKAINYIVRSKEDALHNPQMAVINKQGDKLYIADQGDQGNENFIKIINVFTDTLVKRVNLWMGQRSARPYGIAIDNDDNIYVTAQIDNKSNQGSSGNKQVSIPVSGNIYVYNNDGHFLGFFRNAQDHLERPIGISIISSVDPPSSIAYVVDSPGRQKDGSLKAFIL